MKTPSNPLVLLIQISRQYMNIGGRKLKLGFYLQKRSHKGGGRERTGGFCSFCSKIVVFDFFDIFFWNTIQLQLGNLKNVLILQLLKNAGVTASSLQNCQRLLRAYFWKQRSKFHFLIYWLQFCTCVQFSCRKSGFKMLTL